MLFPLGFVEVRQIHQFSALYETKFEIGYVYVDTLYIDSNNR
jgi:hypothetical protein